MSGDAGEVGEVFWNVGGDAGRQARFHGMYGVLDSFSDWLPPFPGPEIATGVSGRDR